MSQRITFSTCGGEGRLTYSGGQDIFRGHSVQE